MDIEKMMENAQGHWVPKDIIKEEDLLKDGLVKEIFSDAKDLRLFMRTFKYQTLENINTFVELMAEQFETKLGGKKGNVSLLSFDGRLKIQMQVAEPVSFNEKLQIAKVLISECIDEWVEGSSPEIIALVNDAFQVNKEGKVAPARVLGLRKLKIDHPKWSQAMRAISESIEYLSSKIFVRMYERSETDQKWVPISLDIAAL